MFYRQTKSSVGALSYIICWMKPSKPKAPGNFMDYDKFIADLLVPSPSLVIYQYRLKFHVIYNLFYWFIA